MLLRLFAHNDDLKKNQYDSEISVDFCLFYSCLELFKTESKSFFPRKWITEKLFNM